MQTILRRYFFCIVAFLVMERPSAQTPAMEYFSVEEGLPSNEVYRLFQDHMGYIWVATDRGVVRYNGYEFETFTTADGMLDNTIFDFIEDPDHRLWFMTYNGKIGCFDGENFHQYEIVAPPDFNARQTESTGNFEFYGDTVVVVNRFYRNVFLKHKDVFELLKTEKIERYNLSTKELSENASTRKALLRDAAKHIVPRLTSFHHGANVNILRLTEDRYIVSRLTDYAIFDPNGAQLTALSSAEFEIVSIKVFHGKQYMVIRKKGIYEYDADSNTMLQCLPFTHEVSDFLIDNNGVWWISSLDKGILKIKNPNVLSNDGLYGKRIEQVFSNEFVYAGDKTNLYFLKNQQIVTTLSDLDIPNINEHYGKVIVTSNDRKMFFEIDKMDATQRRMAVAPNGYSIISTHSFKQVQMNDSTNIVLYSPFLSLVDNRKNIYSQDDIKIDVGQGKLLNIKKIDDGACLVGGFEGLVKFNFADTTVERYTEKYPLLGNRISDIQITRNKAFVLGTRGAGIVIKYDTVVTAIGKKEGLISDLVTTIYNDNDSVFWISTNVGISKLSIQHFDPLTYTIMNFDETDGLLSKQVNDIEVFHDTVYAATNKGLNYFSKYITKKPYYPPIYIDHIQINQADTTPQPRYELAHTENNIDIWFVGISTKAEGNLRYKYRLSASDSNWRYTANRNIQLLSLPPDEYQIEIYAITADGYESKTPVKVDFIISPPFWATWWFIFLIIVVIISIGIGITFYRFRRLREKEEVKRRLLSSELKALRSQMNPHFTFNAMNSIQNYIRKSNTEEALNYVSKFARLLRMILDNTSEEYITIKREIDALSIYVEIESNRFKEKFNYHIHIDDNVDIHYIKIPSMIIQPYVENAIWHGLMNRPKGGGMLTVNIRSGEEGNIICEVIDNGVGRKKAAELKSVQQTKHKSYGMSISEERLSLLNGGELSTENVKIYDLEDSTGNAIGTKVELILANDE